MAEVQRLEGLDTAFLSLDGPRAVGHLVLLVELDGVVDLAALRERVRTRLASLPVLRRRLVTVPGGVGRPFWDDVDPVVEDHVGTQAFAVDAVPDLLRVAGTALTATPLPRDRPLWRIDLVRGSSAAGRTVVALSVHHAVADGLTIRDTLLALLDDAPPSPAPSRGRPVAPTALRRWTGVLDLPASVASAAGPVAAGLAGLPLSVVEGLVRTGAPPRSRPDAQLDARPDAQPYRWRPDAPDGSLLGFATTPLQPARDLRRTTGASVNDVVLAATAGALRRHLLDTGHDPDGPLRALVPLAVPRTSDGNALALAVVPLPVHVDSLQGRLEAVHGEAVRDHRLVGDETFRAAVRLAVPALAGPAVRLAGALGLGRRLPVPFDLMVSNVPVPSGARSLLGAPVLGLHPVPLVAEGLGLNVTVHGLDDGLHYGVRSAPGVVDAQRLADLVAEEHDALASAGLTSSGRP